MASLYCLLFVWRKKKDGYRRFTSAYIEIPRKNGKSFLAAAIALYMFCDDGEHGAEVYSGATGERQAWEVFRPARLIVERTPELKRWFDVEVNAKTMAILSNGSRFESLIGKPGDGASPSCAIVDEYHEHKDDDLYQTMKTGMGAREQPLLLAITTAGSNMGGPCYALRSDAVHVLNGTVRDPSMFAIMYGIDEDDEWDSEESLIKANPNYNVSVFGHYLVSEMDAARRSAVKQASFKTKHLNVWVGAAESWMNMLSWQKQKKADLTIDDFAGESCHIGVDLATKIDATALSVIFRRGENYYHFPFFWVPELAVEDNDKYRQYQIEGVLTVTEGSRTDYSLISDKIKSLCIDYRVESVAFDPYQSNIIAQELEDHGVPVLMFGQTLQNMSDPMKEVEARVLNGELWHDGNGMMTWMVGNVAAKPTGDDNIKPLKASRNDPRCKIDGAVSMIMAMGRWLTSDPRGYARITTL